MFDRLTDQARSALGGARGEAQRLDHDAVGPEHMLLALLGDSESVAAAALRELGIDCAARRHELQQLVPKGPAPRGAPGTLPFTPAARSALEYAVEEAERSDRVGTGHLLVGIVRSGEGPAAQLLISVAGLSLDRVRAAARAASVLGTATEPGSKVREPLRLQLVTVTAPLLLVLGMAALALGANTLIESPRHHGGVTLSWPYDCPSALRKLSPRPVFLGQLPIRFGPTAVGSGAGSTPVPLYPTPTACPAIRGALVQLGSGTSLAALAVLLGIARGRRLVHRLAPIVLPLATVSLAATIAEPIWDFSLLPLPWSYALALLASILFFPGLVSFFALLPRLLRFIASRGAARTPPGGSGGEAP